jgi:hypothetical protein
MFIAWVLACFRPQWPSLKTAVAYLRESQNWSLQSLV